MGNDSLLCLIVVIAFLALSAVMFILGHQIKKKDSEKYKKIICNVKSSEFMYKKFVRRFTMTVSYYKHVVEYIIDNKTYTKEVVLQSECIPAGENLTGYYNIKDPDDFKVNNSDYVMYLALGTLFLVIGVVLLVLFFLSM